MDISLGEEKVFQIGAQIDTEAALDRVEKKKISLVAGTVGSLFTQPKPEEIRHIATETRLEPFWHIAAASRTDYDRACAYTFPVSSTDVRSATLFGETVEAAPAPKGARTLTISGTEHCVQELRHQQTFDAVNGAKIDLLRYTSLARTEIGDLATFAPAGMLVIPPQIRATAVVRQVMAEVVQPVKNAHVIVSERVDIERIDLVFRPVYAFEFEWASKSKRMVIEFDALGGDMRAGGKRLADQIRNILTRDLLFDVTADAVGAIVPGGSIAVKLVKAVVDRGKR